MKKVLSLVLVIAMVLSSMSFAFASTFEDVTGDYEKAINALAGLGVITGYEDGTYRPEKVVTRAEMAKLMVEILGYGNLVAGAKSNFSDTQGHWADQWIAIAAGRNIVVGTGAGKFTPDRTVSYDEVLTMIVRGLGYTDNSNEIKSMTWPTNFKVKAAELGVTDGVKMAAAGADRGGVAQALYNALDASLVSVNNDGDVVYLKGTGDRTVPLLTRIAQEAGTYNSDEKRYEFEVKPENLDSGHKNYAGDIVDLVPYMYQKVEAYAAKNDSKIIVYVAGSYDETVEGTLYANHDGNATDVVTANGKIDVELADESTETLDISKTASVNVYYNGSQISLKESEIENGIADKTIDLDGAKVTVVLDENDDVKAIVASKATYADRATREYKKDALKLGRIQLPKKGDKVDLSKVTVTGAADSIEDIKIDDVVVAYAAKGGDNKEVPSKVELVVVRDTVEGKITKTNKDADTIYIDGKEYSVSEIPGQVQTFAVGNEGTFFLDDAGDVFASEASTASNAKDYAVVIERRNGKKDDARTLYDADIKLINAAGEVVTYKLDTDTYYQGGNNKSTDKVITAALAFDDDADGKNIVTGALIKYKVDSDNVLTRIEIVKEEADSDIVKTKIDTTSSSFDVAEGAPIFNISKENSTAKADYSVIKADNLPKEINATYYKLNDDGQYNIIVSTNADKSTGTYALITAVNYVENDDEEIVAEFTAYVDGEKKTYLADDNADYSAFSNKGKLVKFTIDSGEVTNVTLATTVSGIAANSYVNKVNPSRIEVKAGDDSKWYELNTDNVAVYVLKSDNKFDFVGNVDDLTGYDIVALYSTDTDASDIEVIIVK